MTKIITHIIISSCMLVFFTANDASASRSEFIFKYKEGMITLKGNNISIMPLLQKITEVSSIEIFVIDDIDSRSINVDFKDRPLEDVLRSILKGCSYAILYYKDKSPKGRIHMMSAFAGKNNVPDLAGGKTYRSKKRKISKERTKQVRDYEETGRKIDAFMRQAGSHIPEQINMVMEKLQKEGIRESSVENKRPLNFAINSPNSHSRPSASPAQAGANGKRVFSSSVGLCFGMTEKALFSR